MFPEDLRVQKYIFDTWRRVCKSYGYEEYQTPLLEPAELYRAKSGEDVGGKELYTFVDQGGRELALRPEMTPSVSRVVAQKYKEWPKPIRLFSIANFFRYEKPQRGRNREFWQLNADILGDESIQADIEILKLAVDLMLAFDPPEGSFKVYINNRKALTKKLEEMNINKKLETAVIRILDKWSYLKDSERTKTLQVLGLNNKQIEQLTEYTKTNKTADPEIIQILNELKDTKYAPWIEYKPGLARGFDYYDGMVFELFDTKPENNRSLFGGGRYNGLAELFGEGNIPAVGFAPGDETTKIFLESWNLIPDLPNETEYLVTLWPSEDPKYRKITNKAAEKLRSQGKNVVCWLEKDTKLDKQLKYADTKGIPYVVIIGEKELEDNTMTIKDMTTGDQTSLPLPC